MIIVSKAETWRLSEQGDVWWGETAGFPAIHFLKQRSTVCYHPQGYTVHTSKVLVSFLASCPWVPAIQSPDKMLNNKNVFKDDDYWQGLCLISISEQLIRPTKQVQLISTALQCEAFQPIYIKQYIAMKLGVKHEPQVIQKLRNIL